MKKIINYISIVIVIFTLTILRYEINCSEESQYGYGHAFVWLQKGYTSLSYQIDLIKLISDFAFTSIIVFIVSSLIKYSINKFLRIIVYIVSLIILILIIFIYSFMEIYFNKIDCDIIYQSIKLGWF